ncbi:MAG TPA: hypothetical protein VNI20_13175 [Fimbriimonadaceae bacterium]|nr:hypothetical protein [Fimbriimonadaceae bacterium]
MGKKPKAVIWYDVYCYLFSLLNFWTAWHAYQAIRDPQGVIYQIGFLANQVKDQQTLDLFTFAVKVGGWSFLCTGTFFGIVALTLTRTPFTKKAWTAHIVHLVFGMSSVIMLPICLPVFLAWFKPEVKAYFNCADGQKD